jgi:hypothetical protein
MPAIAAVGTEPSGEAPRRPSMGLSYRFLWTWDHSMDWAPLADGLQEFGCSNYYYRKPEDFIEDYKRAIDYFSPLGFDGIIIYGLFRDRHGGVEAVKELCRYARRKKMMIIAGVGINAYGGIYWEGKHEFNLPCWLEKHPELASDQPYWDRSGRTACPSKKENLAWNKRAIRWLCETVDIGGINFESGDYGVCGCAQCSKRYGRGHWSVGLMAEQFTPLIEEATKVRPDILPICECYFDKVHDAAYYAPLKDLPANAILQFAINRVYFPQFLAQMDAAKAAALPPHRKIMRTHIGSQWNDMACKMPGERHKFVARDFAALATRTARIGMDGLTIFGEVTAARTVHEINYLAAAAFGDNQDLTWKQFVADKLGPLLGGAKSAEKYIGILEKTKATPQDVRYVKSALCKAPRRLDRRWMWLYDLLYRRME